MRKRKQHWKLLYNFLCLKFFEGFLWDTFLKVSLDAFFQESSPKRVPYKSQFVEKDCLIQNFLNEAVLSAFN